MTAFKSFPKKKGKEVIEKNFKSIISEEKINIKEPLFIASNYVHIYIKLSSTPSDRNILQDSAFFSLSVNQQQDINIHSHTAQTLKFKHRVNICCALSAV